MDSWWLSLGSMDKTDHGHFRACHPHYTATQWLVSQFLVLHKHLNTVRPQNLFWQSGIPSQQNKTIAFDEFWYSCTHDSSHSNDLTTIEWNVLTRSLTKGLIAEQCAGVTERQLPWPMCLDIGLGHKLVVYKWFYSVSAVKFSTTCSFSSNLAFFKHICSFRC